MTRAPQDNAGSKRAANLEQPSGGALNGAENSPPRTGNRAWHSAPPAASWAWAELAEAFPCVHARGVAVRPVDLEGVVPDQLHVPDDDVVRDGGAIERAPAGVLIHAGGAGALTSEFEEGVKADVALLPGDLEIAVLPDGANVFRRFVHGHTFSRERSHLVAQGFWPSP